MRVSGQAPPAPGLANFRDLGGLAGATGAVTRRSVLYRSDAPAPGDRPPAQAAAWPPGLVLDLRGPRPHGIEEHPLRRAGALVRSVALMSHEREYWDPHTWRQLPGLDVLYLEFLRVAGSRASEIFDLLDHADGPVLVHCAAGKDRTGVLIALLLRAAGVRREAVIHDYRRTEQNMPEVLRRMALDIRLLDELDEADRLRAEQLIGTSTPAITNVLDELDSAPGGASGWLTGRGVSGASLRRWRHRLLT